MDWRELEQRVDRELKALPAPAAPDALARRVMAAVRAPRQSWYSRAWLAWPLEAQVASLIAVVAAGYGAWWLWPSAAAALASLGSAAAPVMSWVSGAAEMAARALAISRAAWLVVGEPVLLAGAWVAVVASLVAAACWAAVSRLALGGVSLR